MIAKINEMFQDIKAETESKYKTYTAEVDQDRQKIKDIIAHLECTLNDQLQGKAFDTKVFLNILEILQIIEQCKTDANNLNSAITSVKMSFLPEKWIDQLLSSTFKLGSMSIATEQPQVKTSLPEISFPSSTAQPPALSHDHTGRVQTGT